MTMPTDDEKMENWVDEVCAYLDSLTTEENERLEKAMRALHDRLRH